MRISLAYLDKLEAERERAQAMTDDAGSRRNEAVLLLVEGGTQQSEIAERLGVSPTRVSQIVRDARRRREQLQQGVAA
jgi:DNA-directed RNA polymerase specialized sigma24 family protein